MSAIATSRPAVLSRLEPLEWALVGATFLAPLRIPFIRAFKMYELVIMVLALYLVVTRARSLRPLPRSLLAAAALLVVAGLYSAFRSTLPIEAVNMDLQYAFIFFVQLPVIVALARRPAAIEANIVSLSLGFALVAAVAAFTGDTQSAGRAVTFYTDNANALGVPAAFVTPLLLAVAVQRWREGHRVVAVLGSTVVLSILTWAVAASASRGATIATLVSTSLFYIFAEGLDLRGRELRRLLVVVSVVAVVLVVFFATPLFPAKLKDRITGSVPTSSVTAVEDDRIALDRAGVREFMQSPIVGTGFDNFRYVAQFYDQDATEHDPHNLLIQFLATTGIVGAGAMTFIILRWFMMMFRVARRTASRAQREIVWALFCGFIGIMIVGIATPVIVLRPYWVIYGLGLAAAAAIAPSRPGRAPSSEPNEFR